MYAIIISNTVQMSDLQYFKHPTDVIIILAHHGHYTACHDPACVSYQCKSQITGHLHVAIT